MKCVIGLVLASWGLMFTGVAIGEDHSLPRASAESQGVSSVSLLEFVEALDARFDGMHSVMVVRHGHVIAEGWWAPYDSAHNHVLYSLSKSFTSTAVGLAVAEGKISIDDRVTEIFPHEAPMEMSDNLKSMRVRDLLTMTAGHQNEPSAAPDAISARAFLAHPVPHLPGTHFKYNTAATFMQSAIVQKVTGETVLNYLQPRLFEPLGIENPVWDTNHQGISLGGYGLRVRTEDIAKFGQLYLQKGEWQGQQLVSPEWIEQATSKQVSNGSNPESDWNQGYGFQFWRCRNNAYRGDGAFGQFCIVLPEQDTVVAITSGIGDMQAVLNVVWEKLVPSLGDDPLPDNESAQQTLEESLSQLNVPFATGEPTSPLAESLSSRRFEFAENDQKMESVQFVLGEDPRALTLIIEQDGQRLSYPAGFKSWRSGRSALPRGTRFDFPDEPLAGSYGWEGETLNVKVCAIETPFHWTFRLDLSNNQLTFNSETNVAFGPTGRPTLKNTPASLK